MSSLFSRTTPNVLVQCGESFNKWRKRRKTLKVLADLDDRQLRDIGLTREDTQYHALAGDEAVRPEYLRHKSKETNVD